MKKILVASAAGLLLGGAAFAMAHMEADADGDGMISYEELTAVHADLTQEDFDSADADGDGMLNDEEMTAAMEAGTIPSGEEEG